MAATRQPTRVEATERVNRRCPCWSATQYGASLHGATSPNDVGLSLVPRRLAGGGFGAMVEGASPKARVSGGRRPHSNLDGRIVNGAPSVTRGKRSRERGVSVTGTGRTGTSYADPADDPSKKWARGCADCQCVIRLPAGRFSTLWHITHLPGV